MRKRGKHFSIIQKDMAIDGNVSVKGEIVIGGTLIGTVSASRVVISKGGDVNARIRAHSVIIAGTFNGEILAREITVVGSGICSGEVKCTDLVIEPGGNLNASVIHTADSKLRSPSKHIPHSPSPQEKVAVTGK
jgi:cytoskeletal protein CcmA (bactofilin family)